MAAPGPHLLRTDRGTDFAWRRLILAVGAREFFLPFPGWTLPHVVGAGALTLMVKTGLPVRGKRVVVAGSGPLLLAVAAELRQHGARVVRVVEQADLASLLRFGLTLPRLAPAKFWQGLIYRARLLRVPYQTGCWPVAAQGGDAVEAVVLTDGRRRWTDRCDYLACGFGLVPNLELAQLLGCHLNPTGVRVDHRQETSVPGVFCAGEPTGIGGAERALVEGQLAGFAAAEREEEVARLQAARLRHQRFADALAHAFVLRAELKNLAAPDTLVCRCEDVPHRELVHCRSWTEAKLHTRCGMGPCQGRLCGAATRFLYGWELPSARPRSTRFPSPPSPCHLRPLTPDPTPHRHDPETRPCPPRRSRRETPVPHPDLHRRRLRPRRQRPHLPHREPRQRPDPRPHRRR
ncbi:MAG: NAD(P)/FAD-dependent oxidoreductase [Verrucomicrobia bacterium]|nr:NAD(P)/FAD-dependent oxidoreductase [Verrucomicrobiota bacterium]